MANKLTRNYKPRVEYNSKYPLSHSVNKPYVQQLAKFFMERIKQCARPYHEKHKGVKDSGSTGKMVSVTLEQIEKIIIKSNGKSPDGVLIHFAPIGILKSPTEAEEFGFITSEQRGRFPSMDRIVSSIGYDANNMQLTTKRYNLGKSTSSADELIPSINNVTIKWNGAEFEFSNITASFLADTMKELAK